MKSFTDNQGRAWTLTINVDAIRRVRTLANVDLLTAIETDLVQKLSIDPVLLCDVIYALAKPQADALNVSDEDFGRAMAGDSIDGATTALLEELVDFFPKERRVLLGKVLDKLKKLQGMALRAVEIKLESPALENQMKAALAELDEPEPPGPGNSSGSSPESSASTPAP